jgi:hypothetical protein
MNTRTTACSPSRQHLEYCFLESELESLATLYNTHTHTKKLNKSLKDSLFNQLDNALLPFCGSNNPMCWSSLEFLKNSPQLKYTLDNLVFKPILHKNRYAWLSTSDINTIMIQYTQFDPSFTFLGTFPSDFINLYSKEYLFKLLYNSRNYKKIAIVFNLDTSNQTGSHWVCVYIDNVNNCLEYFDSLGNIPIPLIHQFILFFINHFPMSIKINHTILQKNGPDCGIYVLYYILNRILDYSISDILVNSINDLNINHFRDILYAPRK